MTNFNFEYKGTFLRYKDSNGNLLDLNGSQVDTDLDERTEQNENDIAALQQYFDSISVKEDASGGVASFADGAEDIPVKSLVVNIEPIQEGTGDPSPENVRPISGRQSVTVTRAGVNVWDEEWESGTINTTTGNKHANINRIRSKNYIPVAPNSTYYISISNYSVSSYGCTRYAYDIDKNPIGVIGSNYSVIFTTPGNCYFIMISPNEQYGATYKNDISINYPSTDTDYHPGTVQSVTMQLGQTVYGGTVDVVSGEMVVDRAMVDLGTLTWISEESEASGLVRASAVFDYGIVYNSTPICSKFEGKPPTGYLRIEYNQICFSNSESSPFIRVRWSELAGLTNEQIRDALTGVQFCYELAQPLTITLTPEQLTTVLGQNNVWSDAGDVSVDYVADTKLYIDSAIAASADSTESVNANNREEVKETVNEIEKPDVIEEKEVKDDNIEEEREI